MLRTDLPASTAPVPRLRVARHALLPAAGVGVLALCVALSLALGSRSIPLATVLYQAHLGGLRKALNGYGLID